MYHRIRCENKSDELEGGTDENEKVTNKWRVYRHAKATSSAHAGVSALSAGAFCRNDCCGKGDIKSDESDVAERALCFTEGALNKEKSAFYKFEAFCGDC